MWMPPPAWLKPYGWEMRTRPHLPRHQAIFVGFGGFAVGEPEEPEEPPPAPPLLNMDKKVIPRARRACPAPVQLADCSGTQH